MDALCFFSTDLQTAGKTFFHNVFVWLLIICHTIINIIICVFVPNCVKLAQVVQVNKIPSHVWREAEGLGRSRSFASAIIITTIVFNYNDSAKSNT